MMNILLLLCLSLSLVALLTATSCSSKTKPRREGFLRDQCFPGFYEGSCLIIIKKKLSFRDAKETCRYDYGGRLATAPQNNAYKVWAQTVYFNHHEASGNARYWIGYRRHGEFNYEEPNEVMGMYISRTVWDRVFDLTRYRVNSVVQWESGANKNSLDDVDSECPEHGAVFNPTNLKFDVKSNNEEQYALCETPRWAKLQCNTDWHLIPRIRMCVKVLSECVDFFSAAAACRKDASHISVAQNEEELDWQRHVIKQYRISSQCHTLMGNMRGFWTGLKSWGIETYSLDGTESNFTVVTSPNSQDNNCQTHYYKNIWHNGEDFTGLSVRCKSGYRVPYMCQRFADQSLQVNVA